MATSCSVCVYIVYDNRANFVRIIERLIGIHPYGGCAEIAPPLKDTRVGIMECKSQMPLEYWKNICISHS